MDTQWNTINTVGGYFDSGSLMDMYGIIDDFSFVKVGRHKGNTISMFCSLKYSLIDMDLYIIAWKWFFFILKA